jgi:hypothetical protein
MEATIERYVRFRSCGSTALRTFLAAVAALLAAACSTDAGEKGKCHQPERAYSDGLALASGVAGQHGTRNTPSLLDVGRQRSLFWDGRRTRLEDQALDPLLSPVEHGLRDPAELLARLRSDVRYAAPVLLAYGISMEQLTAPQVTRALAAFERTLSSAASPFDRFWSGNRMQNCAPAQGAMNDHRRHRTAELLAPNHGQICRASPRGYGWGSCRIHADVHSDRYTLGARRHDSRDHGPHARAVRQYSNLRRSSRYT